MMNNRDFKGVWIPKEIWLNKDLSLIERVVLTEIDSLDNENNCTAGNEYLAELCQCSERKISDAIKKLANLGYIEVISFDGRHRKIKSNLRSIAINSMQGSKICYAESQNLQANNIDNNKTNNIYSLSKDKEYTKNSETEYESHSYSTDDFLGSRKKTVKPKSQRKSLYSKCMDEISLFTQDLNLHQLLVQYLDLRLAMKDKPIYGVAQWKALLNKLDKIHRDNVSCSYESIVQQSIERGYASFFPVGNSVYKKKDTFSEGDGLSREKATDTADERKEKLEKQGKRSEF